MMNFRYKEIELLPPAMLFHHDQQFKIIAARPSSTVMHWKWIEIKNIFVVIFSTAIVSTMDLDDIVRGSSFAKKIFKHDHLLKFIQDAFVSFLDDEDEILAR